MVVAKLELQVLSKVSLLYDYTVQHCTSYDKHEFSIKFVDISSI
jgi:hypothetical protein